jgi:ABC-type uncharacterized transport system permease subunit
MTLFGVTHMVQFQVQVEAAPAPYELLLSLPYLTTVAALAWRGAGAQPPASLGVLYRR